MANESQEHPAKVDVNTPVTNPSLVSALNELSVNPTDGNKDRLLIELNKATYLLATLPTNFDLSEPAEDGSQILEKGSKFEVLLTSDNDGKTYLPLFTDWEQISLFHKREVSTIIQPAPDAWHWALFMGEPTNVVINPGRNALVLSVEQLRYLYSKFQNSE